MSSLRWNAVEGCVRDLREESDGLPGALESTCDHPSFERSDGRRFCAPRLEEIAFCAISMRKALCSSTPTHVGLCTQEVQEPCRLLCLRT